MSRPELTTLFSSFALRGVTLPNRIVVAAWCQYSSRNEYRSARRFVAACVALVCVHDRTRPCCLRRPRGL